MSITFESLDMRIAISPPAIPARVPTLDGLRAVSILAVILGHSVDTYGGPNFLGPLRHMGNLGVRMFFVISGFLITTLLLKELQRSGRISLKDFYIRRTLRIWPAFFAFVGIVYAIYLLGYVKMNPGDLLHSVTFTMNYHHDDAWVFSHLWSLSVEEQFYLLWPFALSILGPTRAFPLACAVLLLSPLIRAGMWYWWGVSDVAAMTRQFQAVADSLAIGCLLSCAYNALVNDPRFGPLIRSPWCVLLAAAFLVSSFASYFVAPSWFYVFTQSIANVALALLVIHFVATHDSPVGRVLNSRPLVVIGVLSYSLYLWQNLFMNPDSNHWFTRFPANLFLTFTAATISYLLIEKPFQALRGRFTGSAKVRAPDAMTS